MFSQRLAAALAEKGISKSVSPPFRYPTTIASTKLSTTWDYEAYLQKTHCRKRSKARSEIKNTSKGGPPVLRPAEPVPDHAEASSCSTFHLPPPGWSTNSLREGEDHWRTSNISQARPIASRRGVRIDRLIRILQVKSRL